MGVKTRKLGNANNSFVEWQSVVTASTLNAVAGRGYFINTTSNACTVTLPTPKVGDVIRLKDYARTWNTNKVSIASALMDGATTTTEFTTQGQTVSIVYMDGTKGWSVINEDTTSQLQVPPTFIAATGGTVATSGDFKIHSFTGDTNFVVSSIGNAPVTPLGGPNAVSYVVVAGGGGGGVDRGGGGGAGGFREGRVSSPEYTASPLATTGLAITAQTYPITVGAGGAIGVPMSGSGGPGGNGANSVFSTITSTGGGGGKTSNSPTGAGNGGSGGGGAGSGSTTAGTGNTPPVSPPQGNNGGASADGSPFASGAGGGGAGAAGANANLPSGNAPDGGAGVTSSITGSSVARAGGGGSTGKNPASTASGGSGGGGDSNNASNGVAGTANTGGGGGSSCQALGGAGGKGIVIIRYKFQ